MNLLKSKSGYRGLNNCAYTATRTYYSADFDKTVVLVGTVHVGETKYYTELYEEISRLERELGAQVHFERVSYVPDGTEMTDSERERIEQLRELRVQPMLADLLQLPYQLDALPPQDHWINTDMNVLEFIRAHPDVDFVDMAKKTIDSINKMDDMGRRSMHAFGHWALRHPAALMTMVQVLRPLSWLKGTPQLKKSIILDKRNLIAFHAALAAPGNVIAIWGAGHLSGLHKLFKRAGFDLTGEHWHLALDETTADD